MRSGDHRGPTIDPSLMASLRDFIIPYPSIGFQPSYVLGGAGMDGPYKGAKSR
jgi:hypothetical protein